MIEHNRYIGVYTTRYKHTPSLSSVLNLFSSVFRYIFSIRIFLIILSLFCRLTQYLSFYRKCITWICSLLYEFGRWCAFVVWFGSFSFIFFLCIIFIFWVNFCKYNLFLFSSLEYVLVFFHHFLLFWRWAMHSVCEYRSSVGQKCSRNDE